MGARAGRVLRSLLAVARSVPTGKQGFLFELRKFTTSVALFRAAAFPAEVQSALGIIYARELLDAQKSDITLATDYKTVLPVALYGSGSKFYFSQHYEPYFAIDNPNPLLAEQEAWMSYQQDVRIIANSSWLKSRLHEEFGFSNIAVCPNAINHETFTGNVKDDDFGRTVKVISYGGRDAQWKGFKEMAQAVAIARSRLPQREVRWLVYGSSILPPKNLYADYESLGFLTLPKLAHAYRESDLLLSASWYESFPLFPIEAMACGLPVVTTRLGTEEYAKDADTAQIVEARDPESIAAGLVKLIEDSDYRRRLARNGQAMARRFTWESAVNRMEQIVLSGVSA
jgi:glycosyltransferase involved in cell wall biosynthesis